MYTLQHRIFFVSNLASRLFCTFPLSLYLLHPFFFSPPTFYPLYPHIYRYIQRKKEREREKQEKKKLFIFHPTKSIAIPESSVDEVCFTAFTESAEKFVSPPPLSTWLLQKHGGGDAHPVSHDERIMNVLCANIFSTLPINVTANRQYNYAFQLMKQSPPRPCYLSSRVVFRREMATT